MMDYLSRNKSSNIKPYDNEKAVKYAHEWAMKRNPGYLNFDKFGGDCTNFASQVIFAGSEIMNMTPVYGWYYINSYKRTASWTGVNYLYNFLIGNKGVGPFAEQVDFKDVKPGDIIQLAFTRNTSFDHSPVVVSTGSTPSPDNILICAHTYDRENYTLSNYNWVAARCLHIKGVRY